MNKNTTKIVVSAVAVVIIGYLGLTKVNWSSAPTQTAVNSSGNVGTKAGDIAPDFNIQTIDGQTISLNTFRGKKALLITSTASWCPTCIFEAEEISPVYPLYKDDIEFLSVSIDPTDDRLKLEAFKANLNTPWLYTEPKLLGVRDMIIDYRFNRFEITYIIDKNGIIRFKDSSITAREILEDELEKLFGSKTASAVAKPELGDVFDDQGQTHIKVGETHPLYNSNPPTSGWHYAQPADGGAFSEELPDEQLIHNLEHGGIWIAYNPDIGKDQIDTIHQLVSQYPTKVIATPRSKNDSAIAVASWQRLLKVEVPLTFEKLEMIHSFIKQYKNRGPEFIPDGMNL